MERRNLILTIILTLLSVAVVIVAILIIRKRGVIGDQSGVSTTRRQPATMSSDTKPFDAYEMAKPYEAGGAPPPIFPGRRLQR